MSIISSLGSLFNAADRSTSSDFGWNNLETEEELENLFKASQERPQVLYKHSTRCATSYFALKNIESVSPIEKELADFYMVDVISQRPLSMYISEKLGIRHESPQLFVIKGGEVVWHGSHHQVTSDQLENILK